jgi:hypothetical protein
MRLPVNPVVRQIRFGFTFCTAGGASSAALTPGSVVEYAASNMLSIIVLVIKRS